MWVYAFWKWIMYYYQQPQEVSNWVYGLYYICPVYSPGWLVGSWTKGSSHYHLCSGFGMMNTNLASSILIFIYSEYVHFFHAMLGIRSLSILNPSTHSLPIPCLKLSMSMSCLTRSSQVFLPQADTPSASPESFCIHDDSISHLKCVFLKIYGISK